MNNNEAWYKEINGFGFINIPERLYTKKEIKIIKAKEKEIIRRIKEINNDPNYKVYEWYCHLNKVDVKEVILKDLDKVVNEIVNSINKTLN